MPADSDQQGLFQQHRLDKRTQSLLIKYAEPRFTGVYLCVLEDSHSKVYYKPLHIIVQGRQDTGTNSIFFIFEAGF